MNDKSLPLSARKNKKKLLKPVKAVLANPTEPFWPVVPSHDAVPIIEQLKGCLTLAKINKLKIPWSQKRDLTKEERQKNDSMIMKGLSPDKQTQYRKAMELREDLMLGVNSVSRGIENGDVACCVLAEEATPIILVKHVAALAHQSKVPVLVLQQLKTATINSIGFSCLALAFKKSVLADWSHPFYDVCQSIRSMAETICEKNTHSSEISFDDTDNLLLSLGTLIPRKKFTVKNINKKELHLFRNSNDHRVFRPMSKSDTLPDQNKSITEEQFISLSSLPDGNSAVRPVKALVNRKKRPYTETCQTNVDKDSDPELDNEFSIDTAPSNVEAPQISNKQNLVCKNYKQAKVLMLQSNPNKVRKNKGKYKMKKPLLINFKK